MTLVAQNELYLSNHRKKEENESQKYLDSIFFLEGVSILFIIFINLANFWLVPQWRYGYVLLALLLDGLGPILFIFLSSVSVVFMINKRMGIIPERHLRNNNFMRGGILIFIGLLLNYFTNLNSPFPFNVWGWNLILFVGMAQILSYFIVWLSRGLRVGIGIAIIYTSDQLRLMLLSIKDQHFFGALLHYIFVSPVPEFSLIPHIALCFFGTIFGELILEAKILQNEEANKHVIKTFSEYGALFVAVGVYFGFQPARNGYLIPEEYSFISFIKILQNALGNEYLSIPLFLIRGTSPNLFFNLGICLFAFSFGYYFFNRKIRNTSLENGLIFYGKKSLTVYLIHLLFLLLYFRSLTMLLFIPVSIFFIGFIGVLVYTWTHFYRGKYSLEWIFSKLKFQPKSE